ncbi:MAG: integrase/recombinase XerD, partial [Clostridia bacterium]|nr:integrase/recombinase XerD [Clostridia bacterium]
MKRKKLKNSLDVKFGESQLKPGGDNFDLTVQLFIKRKKLNGLRQKTLDWYELMLNIFKQYLQKNSLNTAPVAITREMIEDFILGLRENGNKAVSVNGKIRALRVFFNFLEKEKIILNSPIRDIILLRDIEPVVPTFSEEQL